MGILELVLVIGGAVANRCGGNVDGVKMEVNISRE